MRKNDIPALIPIILAFVVIFGALTCGVVAIGYEFDLFGSESESTKTPESTKTAPLTGMEITTPITEAAPTANMPATEITEPGE